VQVVTDLIAIKNLISISFFFCKKYKAKNNWVIHINILRIKTKNVQIEFYNKQIK